MSLPPVRVSVRPLDDATVDENTAHYAEPRTLAVRVTTSLLVFRLGAEWLAIPTARLARVTGLQLVHSLPHRRSGAPAGLVNVDGELIVHVSLGNLLGVSAAVAASGPSNGPVAPRLLVVTDSHGCLAMTVDGVWGVYRYEPSQLKPVPASQLRPFTFMIGILHLDERTVGVLDIDRLMVALSAGIA
jgi:chemotaxis-related protein WspD